MTISRTPSFIAAAEQLGIVDEAGLPIAMDSFSLTSTMVATARAVEFWGGSSRHTVLIAAIPWEEIAEVSATESADATVRLVRGVRFLVRGASSTELLPVAVLGGGLGGLAPIPASRLVPLVQAFDQLRSSPRSPVVGESRASRNSSVWRRVERAVWRWNPGGLDPSSEEERYEYDELVAGLTDRLAQRQPVATTYRWAAEYLLDSFGVDLSTDSVAERLSDLRSDR